MDEDAAVVSFLHTRAQSRAEQSTEEHRCRKDGTAHVLFGAFLFFSRQRDLMSSRTILLCTPCIVCLYRLPEIWYPV